MGSPAGVGCAERFPEAMPFPAISPPNGVSVNYIIWAEGVLAPRWASSLSSAFFFGIHHSHLQLLSLPSSSCMLWGAPSLGFSTTEKGGWACRRACGPRSLGTP